MIKFLVASKQVVDLDNERIRTEMKIRDMEKESSRQAGERRKLEDEVKDLINLVEELKVYIVKKDTHLDHLQKQSDKIRSCLSKSRDEVVKEFKMSSEFTNLLDKNYVAGFEDFCMDTVEAFPRVDFDSLKLPTVAESSLLQNSLEDMNIEDDTSTPLPTKDDSKSRGIAPSGLSK